MLAVGEDCVPEVRLADFGSAFVQPGAMASARAFTRAYRLVGITSDYFQITYGSRLYG